MGGWAVPAALADPEGARRALLTIGGDDGYPERQIGPLRLRKGETGWMMVLGAAPALHLGLAWEAIEKQERESNANTGQMARAPQSPQGKETTQVPVLEWKKGTMVEPGIWPAVVTEIIETEQTFPSEPDKIVQQLQFQFVILGADGSKTNDQIRGWTSRNWSTKSKLFAWAKVLLRNKCPKENEPLDTDLLIGRKCDLEVVEVGTDGRTKINQLYPYRTMSATDDDGDHPAPKAPANGKPAEVAF